MKYIILVGDGMADYPIPELGSKTPLQVADTPNMDLVARKGVSGMVKTIPENMPPGSDVANLSVLGYDPEVYYTGRGPLEAGSMGIKLGSDDVAYRCNIVSVRDGVMVDYSSGHITSGESRELMKSIDDGLGTEEIRFHAGVSYRHLLIHRGGSESLRCIPPHDITGEEYEKYLPTGEGQEVIRELMERSKSILADHPVNRKRMAAGKNPGNMIWPWGQGRAPHMPTLFDKFGFTGSVISAVDLIKGIGYYAGLDIIRVPGATGYLDTNYLGKAEYALEALLSSLRGRTPPHSPFRSSLFQRLDSATREDFVWVHVEAPDEAGHAADIDAKIKAIEQFDSKVVGTILRGMEKSGEDYLLMVLPDHLTPISVRTHIHGPVPFAACGPGIESNQVDSFCEAAAGSSGMLFEKGYELMPYLLETVKG